MPLVRVFGVGVLALVFLVGSLWAMDVNYGAWVGAWLSPKNQYQAGFGVIVIVGLIMAWVYARFIGDKFPMPGMVRGVIYGLVLAVAAIWFVPYTLEGIASAVGNTQVVYGGRGIIDKENKRSDEVMAEQMTRVEPCPPLFGVKPPFAKLTRDRQWASADAWKGRLLPFGIAFALYGLIVGSLLSEKFDNKK
ncbi:MAG: hypothetical protein HS108_14905 [Planctomycetes bacterium]|jgi:hypothetical protein|nr:hypothetical protein [Planctomycetota bacterium]